MIIVRTQEFKYYYKSRKIRSSIIHDNISRTAHLGSKILSTSSSKLTTVCHLERPSSEFVINFQFYKGQIRLWLNYYNFFFFKWWQFDQIKEDITSTTSTITHWQIFWIYVLGKSKCPRKIKMSRALSTLFTTLNGHWRVLKAY